MTRSDYRMRFLLVAALAVCAETACAGSDKDNRSRHGAADSLNESQPGEPTRAFAEQACGNGLADPGEVCDDGTSNGLPGHCDSGCQFRCEGACPLRVNPNMDLVTDGRSWDAALGNLQAALDRQAELGGGEVWVLGGSFPRLTAAGKSLITLRSAVSLRGGFAGHERLPEERAPATPHTLLRGPSPVAGSICLTPNYLLAARGEHDISIERVDFEGGSPGLFVQGSVGIVLRECAFRNVLYSEFSVAQLTDSEVRFETTEFSLRSFNALRMERSKVAWIDSHIAQANPDDSGRIEALNSRLLLERSRFGTEFNVEPENTLGLFMSDSQLLLLNSALRGGSTRGSVLVANRSTVIVVGSQFSRTRSGTEPITQYDTTAGTGAFFAFNSSFGEMGGFRYARAGVLATLSAMEIAASTFYENRCQQYGEEPCRDIYFAGRQGLIHNSLFIDANPAWSGVVEQKGNCFAAADAFEFGPHPSGQVLARQHPCPNAGDAAALEASRQRLLELTRPFRDPPFRANVSRYDSPGW